MDESVGELKRVHPRQRWNKEDVHFTNWLAEPSNLQRLGKALGLELEQQATEHPVGTFRADIVCRHTLTGAHVLIENQLERTDHSHLGQVLTYAAGLEAVIVVWVASEFAPEHRATLDWLNRLTAPGLDFFGVEVELWQIDDRVAPRFNVVSQPAGSAKHAPGPRELPGERPRRRVSRVSSEGSRPAVRGTSSPRSPTRGPSSSRSPGALTPWQQLCVDYWAEFAEFVRATHGPVHPHEPTSDAWYNVAIGSSNCYLYAGIEYQRINVRIEVVGEERDAHFRALHAQKSEIEAQLGSPLDWQPLPDRLRSRIVLKRLDGDVQNRADWPAQHQWLLEKLTAFHRGVCPVLS